jgi:hypothetical protein
VTVWRKALGVSQYNEGTLNLNRRNVPERFTPEVVDRVREASRRPERCAKIAAAKRGKPRPPHVQALPRTVQLVWKHTEAARAKMRARRHSRCCNMVPAPDSAPALWNRAPAPDTMPVPVE